MSARIGEIALDCADPRALADFWTAALGYTIGEVDDGYVELVPPAQLLPVMPTIGLVRVPEPKVAKNRLHLDLRAVEGSQDEEVARLVGLGARRVEVGQSDAGPDDEAVTWVVLADPEGNEFCVLRGPAAPL